MQDLGFWQAVGLWWDGQKLENFSMYGLPMLWWVRIGKYLQFAGGAIVLIDVIGPRRFRRTALQVRARGRWMRAFPLARLVPMFVGVMLLAVGAIGLFFIAAWDGWAFEENPNPGPVGLSAILACYALMAVSLVLSRLDAVLLRFAKLIAIGQHGNAWKWASFVLLVIGFHLDLLAS